MKKATTKKVKTKKAERIKRPRTRSLVIAPFCRKDDEPPNTKYHDVEDIKIPKAAWLALLNEISERGNITDSCKVIGIKRITAYKRAGADPEGFGKLFHEAHKQGLRRLEDHAVRRAVDGVQKPVFFQGVQVAEVTEYSDQLLQFLLQGNDPKYKRKQEITGAEGGPLALLVQLTDDELDKKIAQLGKEASTITDE